MSSKSFEDLIKEVHEKGICQLCGGCINFCTSVDDKIIGFKSDYSPPEYLHKENCLECGICYYICPQTKIADNSLNKTYNFTDYKVMPLGNYDNIHSCQSTDKILLEKGTDGGVVNSILNYLLEKKLIDGAIVSKTKAPFSRDSMLAKDKNDLIEASGSKLEISSQLDEIQKFSTYTHSISSLNTLKVKKLAVVGTPCQIYTIRCMQDLAVTSSENVEYCFGLFCYENFFFDKSQIEKFEKDFNIQFKNIKKVNIKEDLILKVTDGASKEHTVHIPFNHLEKYMRSACNACGDFTNIYSDISFGGLGSVEKYTTVIPRTEKGKKLYREVLDKGIISCQDLSIENREKMKDLIMQIAQSKMHRQEKFVKNL